MKLRLTICLFVVALLANGSIVPVPYAGFIGYGESSVELSSFQVNDMENKVALSWATVTEKNANHIYVERSVDGKKWASVSKIKAAENSDHVLYYEYFDEAPLKGISYYRLRVEGLEKSKAVEYSEVKTVERNKEVFVIVYPDKTPGLLNLASSYNANEIVVEVFDATGKQQVVISEVVSDDKLVLDVADLSKGVYSVSVKSLEGKALNSQKFTLK